MTQRQPKESFIIVKQINQKGPLHIIHMCAKTLQPLAYEPFEKIPDEWAPQDFYDYLEEGKRFEVNKQV